MTIKQFANQQAISTQAVYKKLKRAGINPTSIKQGDTQEITEEGIKLLCQLFDNQSTETEQSTEALKVEIKLLNQRLQELTADRDRWAEIAKTAQEALQREQQATQQAQALQMATLQTLKRPSIWARLTGKTKSE